MNKELCTVLKNDIAGLPFIHDLAGLVQTLTVENMADDFNNGTSLKTISRFPVAHDTNITDVCSTGPERRLDPDSSKKSITYFEDFGTTAGERELGVFSYRSSVRLVCWLNRALLVGDSYAEISGYCIAKIIAAICPNGNPRNVGIFSRLKVQPGRIHPQDAAIFARYTYDEVQRQYLRPPFEFFAIDLVADYLVAPDCLPDLIYNSIPCI
jgi:hypothetical protein